MPFLGGVRPKNEFSAKFVRNNVIRLYVKNVKVLAHVREKHYITLTARPKFI